MQNLARTRLGLQTLYGRSSCDNLSLPNLNKIGVSKTISVFAVVNDKRKPRRRRRRRRRAPLVSNEYSTVLVLQYCIQ